MENKNYLSIALTVLLASGLIIGGVYAYRQSGGRTEVDAIQQAFEADSGAVNPGAQLPNPASVNCTDKGGELEIRTGEDGGQYGVCKFQDGSECEEWALFRGECEQADY